jgi:hypothetical protein
MHEVKFECCIGQILKYIGKFPAFAEIVVFWLVIYEMKKQAEQHENINKQTC